MRDANSKSSVLSTRGNLRRQIEKLGDAAPLEGGVVDIPLRLSGTQLSGFTFFCLGAVDWQSGPDTSRATKLSWV